MSNELKELMQISIIGENKDLSNMLEDIVPIKEQRFTDLELEAEKKSIENFFKSEMDGYETAYIGDRKLTLKNQSRSTIDTQKLRTELPDIANIYTKTTTSKVFKISQRVLKKV